MLIPDNINDFDSNGERLMYLRFRNERPANDMYILHSVFTNYHLKNVSGELDFLVLAPGLGIFALEVKHGRVSRKGGVWEFTDKNGRTTEKTKSPFAQVTGTMHSIRAFILSKVKDNARWEKLSKLLWGTGIAFTSMDKLPDFGQEAETWQILTKDGLGINLSNYIYALSKGFHDKFHGKPWYDINASRPSKEDCEFIISLIRGDFDSNYSDIRKLNEGDHIIEEFTKEQFNFLDITNYNDRCLFEGAAGTGKTLLALELFNRKAKVGLKTAFFCYNKKLGEYLESAVKKFSVGTRNQLGSLHRYLLNGVSKSEDNMDHLYFSEQLPLEFLIRNEELKDEEKYEYLIIDEAQDLITPYYLEVFDLILKGGLKRGKWIFFGDFTYQAIYNYRSRQELIEELQAKAGFVNHPPLKINCRNTKKIARHITLLTGAEFPIFLHGGLEGEQVVQSLTTKNNFASTIENLVKELLGKGISAKDIILLAPRNFENSSLSTSDYIKQQMQSGLEFSTIQSFKGLERNIVFLFDFSELETQEAQQLLYVGLSRARQKLYLVIDRNLEGDFNRIIATNSNKLQ